MESHREHLPAHDSPNRWVMRHFSRVIPTTICLAACREPRRCWLPASWEQLVQIRVATQASKYCKALPERLRSVLNGESNTAFVPAHTVGGGGCRARRQAPTRARNSPPAIHWHL